MISLASGQQVTIDGNRFSDTAVPISVGGTDGKASIDGNSINGVRDGAIVIYGGVTAIVSGNTIEGLTTSSRSSRAIRVENDANVELRGNRISGISGPASCAIEIETTGTVEMSENDVERDEARTAFCGSGSP